METLKLKQSRNWWIEKDLKWIIDNASFVYITNGHNGHRPHIVTKEKMRGRSNCFEIDTDGCGITLSSHSEYSHSEDMYITKRSTYIQEFLVNFLNSCGEGQYVNPRRLSIINFFRRKKDVIISVNI